MWSAGPHTNRRTQAAGARNGGHEARAPAATQHPQSSTGPGLCAVGAHPRLLGLPVRGTRRTRQRRSTATAWVSLPPAHAQRQAALADKTRAHRRDRTGSIGRDLVRRRASTEISVAQAKMRYGGIKSDARRAASGTLVRARRRHVLS